MIPRLLLPVLSVIVLAPDLLHAQSAPSGGGGAAPVARADRQMYEDIEIMRHILDRKLHALYPRKVEANQVWFDLNGRPYQVAIDFGFPTQPNNWSQLNPLGGTFYQSNNPNTWFLPQSSNRPHHGQETCHAFEVEGVYLKGQGIVYTATVSSLQTSSKVETARPAVSEWESVQRELRHEKEAPRKPTEANPAPLSDVLLKVLAENGRHFAQLGANESLTIVLTVHEKGQPATARKSAETVAESREQVLTARRNDVLVSKVRDLELLGDLHLKQGKVEEAIRVFQQAVELKSVPKGFRDAAQAASLHRKLAQCYLMLEQSEKAKAEVERAISIHSWPPEAKDKPAPAVKPAAVALPVKLIISAQKQQLDQMGEGKMSFEEFRRRASVETLTFDSHRR